MVRMEVKRKSEKKSSFIQVRIKQTNKKLRVTINEKTGGYCLAGSANIFFLKYW